jgi:hypothetical protein
VRADGEVGGGEGGGRRRQRGGVRVWRQRGRFSPSPRRADWLRVGLVWGIWWKVALPYRIGRPGGVPRAGDAVRRIHVGP